MGVVPAGDGAGAFSGLTLREGSGTGGALRLLLVLGIALAFSFTFTGGLRSPKGVGATSALMLRFLLVLSLAGALITPPAGIPSSAFPVGGCAGWTGWLFGSAANVCEIGRASCRERV